MDIDNNHMNVHVGQAEGNEIKYFEPKLDFTSQRTPYWQVPAPLALSNSACVQGCIGSISNQVCMSVTSCRDLGYSIRGTGVNWSLVINSSRHDCLFVKNVSRRLTTDTNSSNDISKLWWTKYLAFTALLHSYIGKSRVNVPSAPGPRCLLATATLRLETHVWLK